MKKIAAIFLILSLVAPTIVAAAPECPESVCGPAPDNRDSRGAANATDFGPTTGTGDTGAAADNGGFGPAITGTNPEGFGETVFADLNAIAQTGEQIGCQNNGSFGGSLANALGASLQQAIPGLIRNKLGGLINKFASQAGPFGPLVQKLGQIGLDKLSSFAQQKIGELFSSGLTNALPGVAGAIGNSAGAVASELFGGAAGAAGLARVPVIASDTDTRLDKYGTKIDKNTLATQHAAEVLAYKECVADPLYAKVRNLAIATITRSIIQWINTGFEGGPVFVQNLRQFLREGTRAVTEDFIDNQLAGICSPYRQDIQTILLTQYQYEENFGRRTQCSVTPDEIALQHGEEWSVDALIKSINSTGNSQRDALLEALNEAESQQGAHASQVKLDYLTTGGFNAGSEIRCSEGDSEVPVGGYCDGNTGLVVTPGVLIKDKTSHTLGLADEQLLNSDEIGEMIDALMQSLTQVAFDGIDGLLGLSKDQGGGRGSYLDSVVGQGTENSVGTAQNVMGSDIQGAIAIEEAYAGILDDAIKDLGDIKKTYADLVSCAQPKASLNPLMAEYATHASTTVTTIVDPQIIHLTNLLNDAEDALDRLAVLYTESQSALTPQDIVANNTELNALISSGIIHTATDLNFLENDLYVAATALQVLYLDAAEKLAICRAL
ncbi:MAG: hypothetical protein AAB955_01340 [Patescibacteria group bacterium]